MYKNMNTLNQIITFLIMMDLKNIFNYSTVNIFCIVNNV